ncbi:fimbrial protein [Pseudocitrobacter cyperus]|uniref:Type 1 fimbrial protein n=1 Tax=Pseudocitrobacter cyperus TaxID=3112843 RepID=A0ABV0HFQ2_9ENTR
MKAFIGNTLFMLCLTPAFCIDAFAGTERQTNSGVIHFRGQIVEEACAVNPTSHNVNVSCFRDGQRRNKSVSVGALAGGETQHLQDATMNLTWLNTQKTLAVISVQYQ